MPLRVSYPTLFFTKYYPFKVFETENLFLYSIVLHIWRNSAQSILSISERTRKESLRKWRLRKKYLRRRQCVVFDVQTVLPIRQKYFYVLGENT